MGRGYLVFAAAAHDEWPTHHIDAVAHLYVALPDGSDLHRLTAQDEYSEGAPVWSPDGTSVAYATSHPHNNARVDAIYRVALDGSPPTFLAEGTFPRWMPDGRSVLYLTWGGARQAWAVVDATSLEKRQLFAESVANHVDVSPDGTLFAVTSRDQDYGFRLVDERGHVVEGCVPSSHYVEAPVWSPNGRHIAFSAAEDEEGTVHGIYVLERATGNVRRVAGRTYEGPFVWSPDSARLAVVDDTETGYALYVVGLDGTGRRHSLDLNPGGCGEEYPSHPTWSPDGRYLAIRTLETEDWETVIYDVREGRPAHRLAWVPSPFTDMSDPLWQP